MTAPRVLWTQALPRELRESDVAFLESRLELRMLGWYRPGQTTLGVRALIRDGDLVTLLRVRRIGNGRTAFEASSTLVEPGEYSAVQTDVIAAIRQLAETGLERRPPQRAEADEIARLTRRMLADYRRASRAGRVVEERRARKLFVAADNLADLLLGFPDLARGASPFAASPAEVYDSFSRVRSRSPRLLRPSFAVVRQGSVGFLRDTESFRVHELLTTALAEAKYARGFPRKKKKQLRHDAFRSLEASLTGYALLARSVVAADVDLARVGASLLTWNLPWLRETARRS